MLSPLKIKIQQVTDALKESFEDKLRLQAAAYEEQLAIRKEASQKQARLIASLVEQNVELTRQLEELNDAIDLV